MNKLILIVNLVKDPEQRTTDNGIQCSTFTLAVNRRTSSESTDYFRVTAWRQLGALCAKYLSKGRKVCVTGPVSCNVYQGHDGKAFSKQPGEIRIIDISAAMQGQFLLDQARRFCKKQEGGENPESLAILYRNNVSALLPLAYFFKNDVPFVGNKVFDVLTLLYSRTAINILAFEGVGIQQKRLHEAEKRAASCHGADSDCVLVRQHIIFCGSDACLADKAKMGRA